MKAKLRELKGKYYGTVVEFSDDKQEIEDNIKIWTDFQQGCVVPSDRELDSVGLTREQWDSNVKINFHGSKVNCNDVGMFNGTHTESQFDYELASKIVEMINNWT